MPSFTITTWGSQGSRKSRVIRPPSIRAAMRETTKTAKRTGQATLKRGSTTLMTCENVLTNKGPHRGEFMHSHARCRLTADGRSALRKGFV